MTSEREKLTRDALRILVPKPWRVSDAPSTEDGFAVFGQFVVPAPPPHTLLSAERYIDALRLSVAEGIDRFAPPGKRDGVAEAIAIADAVDDVVNAAKVLGVECPLPPHLMACHTARKRVQR